MAPLVLLLAAVAGLVGRTPELCQLCGWALCVQALCSSCPPLRRAGLCVQALPSCPSLGRAPELCQLCGWALWRATCPGLVLLNSVNSVAGLCGWALCPGLALLLSSSWPRP